MQEVTVEIPCRSEESAREIEFQAPIPEGASISRNNETITLGHCTARSAQLVVEWASARDLITMDVAANLDRALTSGKPLAPPAGDLSLFFIYQDRPGLPMALRASGRLTVFPTS